MRSFSALYKGRPKIAVITGASAGVGRATALEFAAHGCDVALLARNRERLETAARECRALGSRALPVPVDVADPDALDMAAWRVEEELGPMDVWVNAAMATVFAPVEALTAQEFKRGTEVTYLGQVFGAMAALKRMRGRNRGTIVNVGSALAYRSLPLQSLYCGAKAAVRGFTDSLRAELIHDNIKVHVCMVDLPAINTPQFDWTLNKTGRKARPVAPVFQPEVAAEAIYFAAFHKRRELWLGASTIRAILANRLAPGLLDRYLAQAGYRQQLSNEALPTHAPANLFVSVDGPYRSHGRFDAEARPVSWASILDRHRIAILASTGLGLLAALRLRARRRRQA
jgi:NAD(P)-dependent dehydrogenase (short-subunit alcohol dehydrogenase family)